MNYKLLNLSVLLLVLFQGGGLLAAPDSGGLQEYEREFSQSFDVDASGSVKLDNRYGEINVSTWNKDQVQIDVTVKVEADNKEKADRTFDRITINFSGSVNRATATTVIGPAEATGFWNKLLGGDISISFGNGGSGNDFKIYYDVKMPAAARLETIAKYCDVRLPDLSGDNVINVGYGDVVAGKLTGSNEATVSYGSIRVDELARRSSLRLRYSEGEVDKADRLEYNGRYSELELGKVNRVEIDAGYDEVEIEAAGNVTVRGNYNEIEIEAAASVDFDGDYTDYSFGKVATSIVGESSYGDVDVEEMGEDFERIEVTTRYADVTIGMPAGRGYDLDLSTRYGDISHRAKGSLRTTEEGNTESLRGTVTGRGNGRVAITTSYGDISLR